MFDLRQPKGVSPVKVEWRYGLVCDYENLVSLDVPLYHVTIVKDP